MDEVNLTLLRRSRPLDRVKNLLNKENEKNAPHKAFGWIVDFLVSRWEQNNLVELLCLRIDSGSFREQHDRC